jgi:cell wall-associated NlpC family hydrolase
MRNGSLAAVAAGLWLVAAGCAPITMREMRDREAGLRPQNKPATQAAVATLTQEAATLPAPEQLAVTAGLDLLGTPQWSLDCSGFTARAWAAAGVVLPRTVREQWTVGVPVAAEDLQAGDLVFFAFSRRPVDHVALYVGGGQVLHVSSAHRQVALAGLDAAPFAAALVGARRPASAAESPVTAPPSGD